MVENDMNPREKVKLVLSYIEARANDLYSALYKTCININAHPPVEDATLTVEAGDYRFVLKLNSNPDARATLNHHHKDNPDDTIDTIQYLETIRYGYRYDSATYRASPYTLQKLKNFIDSVEKARALLEEEYDRQLEKAWQDNKDLLEVAEAWAAEKALRK